MNLGTICLLVSTACAVIGAILNLADHIRKKRAKK